MSTTQTDSLYAKGHIFEGVNTESPIDTGPSYISQAFQDLVKSADWRKGKHARKTFAGLLLHGASLQVARLQTVYTHGI